MKTQNKQVEGTAPTCWAQNHLRCLQAPGLAPGKVTKMWSPLAQGRHATTLAFCNTGRTGGSPPSPSSLPPSPTPFFTSLLWARTQTSAPADAVSAREAEAPADRRGRGDPGSPTASWPLRGEASRARKPRGGGSPRGFQEEVCVGGAIRAALWRVQGPGGAARVCPAGLEYKGGSLHSMQACVGRAR